MEENTPGYWVHLEKDDPLFFHSSGSVTIGSPDYLGKHYQHLDPAVRLKVRSALAHLTQKPPFLKTKKVQLNGYTLKQDVSGDIVAGPSHYIGRNINDLTPIAGETE